MKTSASITTYTLLLLFCTQLNSQIPDNFEFLNHRIARSKPGVHKIHNNDIYYVSHNALTPFTSVHKVSEKKEVETILELPLWDSTSKLFINSDSSFQMVIHNLIEWDIGAPGLLVVNVVGEEISIDTIVSWSLIGTGPFGVLGERFNLTTDNIEKDQNDDWVTFNYDSIYHINKNGIISVTKNNEKGHHHDSFKSSNGKNYTLLHNFADKETTVFQYINNQLGSVLAIPSSSSAINLLNNDTGNYILSDNKIIQYSSDLSAELSSWNLTDINGEYMHVDYLDNQLQLLTSTGVESFLYKLNPNNDFELIYQDSLSEAEKILKFDRLSMQQYLTIGTYKIENISKNLFIRNINIEDTSIINYDRMDVIITEFEATESHIDTINISTNSSGVTTYDLEFNYDFKLTFKNQGQDTIHITNAYSDNLTPWNFFFTHILSFEEFDIGPDMSKSANATFVSENGPIAEVSVAVPGANFMFNLNSSNVVTSSVRTSSVEIISENQFRLYPNPASESISIETKKPVESISIYNSLGHLVYFHKGQPITDIIDISFLNSGNYIVSIKPKNSRDIISSKFIKI